MGLLDSLFGPTGASFSQAYNQGGLLNAIGGFTDSQQPAATPAPATPAPGVPQAQPSSLWEALTGANRPLPANTGADIGANAGAAAATGAFTPASPASAAATGAAYSAATPPPSDWFKKMLGGIGNVTLPAQPMDLSPPPMPLGMAPRPPLDMRGIQALTTQRMKLGL